MQFYISYFGRVGVLEGSIDWRQPAQTNFERKLREINALPRILISCHGGVLSEPNTQGEEYESVDIVHMARLPAPIAGEEGRDELKIFGTEALMLSGHKNDKCLQLLSSLKNVQCAYIGKHTI